MTAPTIAVTAETQNELTNVGEHGGLEDAGDVGEGERAVLGEEAGARPRAPSGSARKIST